MTSVTAETDKGGSFFDDKTELLKPRQGLPLALAIISGMIAASASSFIQPATLIIWLGLEITAISLCSSIGQNDLASAQCNSNLALSRAKIIALGLVPNFLLGFPLLQWFAAETAQFDALWSILGFFALAGAGQIYALRQGQKSYGSIDQHKSLNSHEEVLAKKDALIAELQKAKLESDLARRRAEEANLAKSHFLATMSHELRTPLNAILGFSEVMKTELFGAHLVDCYKDYSADIHASGHYLLMLIDEILDLSRIETGHFELREEPVSLALLIGECQHLLELRATTRKIEIRAAIEPDLCQVFADARAIRQVLLNLLSNAIKFTPVGGKLKIKAGWTVNGGQYFSLQDNGPGIPHDEIPLVMSSFGRGTEARMSAQEGTGLGLAIVKGLVDLHNGKFALRSKPGEGTQVIVTLPPERVLHCPVEKPACKLQEQSPARTAG